MKFRFLILVLIPAIAVVSEVASAPVTPAERPNVLFITIDDLNDWVEPLSGHPQAVTPNFNRLAQRGINFVDAHCNVPICSPSRTSFMTGLYPENNGVFTNGTTIFDVDPAIRTLPQHFADQGYRTLGGGKLFHGSTGAYTEFFQTYGPAVGNQGGPFTREELSTLNQNPTHQVNRGPGTLQATLPLNGMPDVRRDGTPLNNSFDWGPVDVTAEDMPDGEIATWAVETLAADHDRPFFLGVGFYRPHQPLFAPREYFDPFPPSEVQLPVTLSSDLDDLSFYAQRLAKYPLTAGSHATVLEYQQWEPAVAAYLACVKFVDDQLGRVIDALDASTHRDDTWIVVLSDHGYHLGEKEHWGKFTPWSESTRVPLLIVPPRGSSSADWARSKNVTAPVSLIDLYPTLVEMCEINSPNHDLDGRSLTPFLTPAADAETNDRFAVTSVGRGTQTVVDEAYRYVRYFDGSEELYDRSNDPHEHHNLAHQRRFDTLKHELQQNLPDDPAVAHFVRYQSLKIILFADPDQDPIVYPIAPGTGIGGGIGETRDVSEQHGKLLERVQSYLASTPTAPKHLVLTAQELGNHSI